MFEAKLLVGLRLLISSRAILRVILSVVLFAERFAAIGTLIRFYLVVHLGLVLLEVGLLSEGSATARVVTSERALLGVRAQVVEELEGVRDHAVAVVPVLALEEAQFGARVRV